MTLPPVAPEVTAAAVEALTPRLLKKLDAAVEQYGALEPVVDGDAVRLHCGEDAVVTLTVDASGVVALDGQAQCSCLLAPKCLHRAAVLTACPVAEMSASGGPDGDGAGDGAGAEAAAGSSTSSGPSGSSASSTSSDSATVVGGEASADAPPSGPSAAQVAAASVLWSAAATVLAAGIPAAGAVPQSELLRAAHTARLAGLHRSEAAALRVVRGLRSARSRSNGHRLGVLVADLRDLLLTSALLAAGNPDPALAGTARRAYEPGGSLRVHGVCREPVISATGYGGVVTHVLTEDGRWLSVSDVKPGGASRARGAATAPVAIGASALDHAQLSRGGLLIAGATVSADGRLGAGKGVRATPLTGKGWDGGPLAALFAKPLGEAVRERLAGALGEDPEADQQGVDLVGGEVVVLGAAGDRLLVRSVLRAGVARSGGTGSGAAVEDMQDTAKPATDGSAADSSAADGSAADGSAAESFGPVIRLVAAHGHPDLAHTENLRRLAAHPGLRVRVIGRLDPDHPATLRPLAVAPVPDTEATLRLPDTWQGHADLGYDRLQGSHFPQDLAADGRGPLPEPPDPVHGSPLWRLRHIVELAVAGGRGTVAEFAGSSAPHVTHLRRAGLRSAADRAAALAAEADRRGRDVFGRLTDPDPDRYARAWLAAAVQLAATERALVRASWGSGD
jgi:hypothetical protein